MDRLGFTTSVFTGLRLHHTTPLCSKAATRMSISRREAVSGAAGAAFAALLAGVNGASAKSGDAPKISIFGVGGASSPYTAGVQTGGTVQYKEFNADEQALYRRTIDESRQRLESAIDPIKGKSWDDVRSRIRLEMSELRGIVVKVNSNIEDKAVATKADKAYNDFKLAIENLDYAAITKDQPKALKSYNNALKSFSVWSAVTGL